MIINTKMNTGQTADRSSIPNVNLEPFTLLVIISVSSLSSGIHSLLRKVDD